MEIPDTHRAELEVLRDGFLPNVTLKEEWRNVTLSNKTNYDLEFVLSADNSGYLCFVYKPYTTTSDVIDLYDCVQL